MGVCADYHVDVRIQRLDGLEERAAHPAIVEAQSPPPWIRTTNVWMPCARSTFT